MVKTKNSSLTDAEICRQNKWRKGTRLIGDEGNGPTVIQLTAIGEDKILARFISHRGAVMHEGEREWTLHCRNWKRVTNDGE